MGACSSANIYSAFQSYPDKGWIHQLLGSDSFSASTFQYLLFSGFFFLFFFSSLQLPLTLVEYNRDCPPSSSLSLFTKLIAVQQHSYTPHALPFFLFWSPKSLIIWQNPWYLLNLSCHCGGKGKGKISSDLRSVQEQEVGLCFQLPFLLFSAGNVQAWSRTFQRVHERSVF